MKKILLSVAFILSFMANAQLANNKRLIVPEFGTNAGNNKVKTYFPTLAGGVIANPTYTINFSTLGNGLATNASPNVVTMRNNDLYVTLALANQRIYKFPGYGSNPANAIANVSQITADGNDYVGIAFDQDGNLYCSEGNFQDTKIVKYTIASNYSSASKINLGNGGITSYFANITFDTAGNLWATDYLNNRLIVINVANLSTQNATMNQLVNGGPLNAFGSSIGNTVDVNNPLSGTFINFLFSFPEGLAFDNNGNLWVANNNEAFLNQGGTIVKIAAGYLPQIMLPTFNNTTIFDTFSLNLGAAVLYNMPMSPNGFAKFGGLQIDNVLNRIYVTEQQGGAGLWLDIANIAAVTNTYNTHKINIVTTNPGNGGLFLADLSTNFLSSNAFDFAVANINLFPNPSNGSFKIDSENSYKSIVATDVLGKQIDVIKNGDNYELSTTQTGIYYIKITNENGASTTKKLLLK